LSSIVADKGDYAYGNQQLFAGTTNGIEVYDRNPATGVLTYQPAVTQQTSDKSPLLFQSDGQ